MVYREVEEDYPKCEIEMVKYCNETFNIEHNDSNTNDKCRDVQVRRCQIVKRKVKKSQPNTRCERVPIKRCVTTKCEATQTQCEQSVKLVRDLQPQEMCSFTPRRECLKDKECRTVKNKVCREVVGGEEKIQVICNNTIKSIP